MSIKSSLFQIGFARDFFTLYHRQDVSVSTNCEVFFSLHYFQKFLTEISWCFKDWGDIGWCVCHIQTIQWSTRGRFGSSEKVEKISL